MVHQVAALSILLVEDDEDDYFILKDLLNEIPNFDFNLKWIRSFAEAAENINNKSYDIYLFDFYLGEKTGLDLLTLLRKKHKDLPAILLTGKGDQSLVQQTLERGAYDYIEKSKINTSTLERSLRYALQHSQTLSKLRKSEKQYRTVFEHSQELIFIANSDYNLVSISKAAEDYLGYTREELYQMMSSQLFADPMQIAHLEEPIRETGSVSEYRVSIKNKKGDIKEGLLSCVYQATEDGDFYLHGVYSDITERLKAEKMSILNEKTMATSRLMRTLAHEVRNPLTNIALSVESLQEELEDHALQPITEIILRNTKRIDKLIKEVLHTAKDKSLILKPEKVSQAIKQAKKRITDRLKIKNIRFELSTCGSEREILMNLQQLSIAFTNVLVNATEALDTTEHPKIKIRVSCEEKVTVSITDNGNGMTEDELSSLFEPFYTTKNNGIGLGLATTLSILRSHKAEVDVQSKPLKGSTFNITFPTI